MPRKTSSRKRGRKTGEKEITCTPGMGWRVSLSVLVFFGWLVFLVLWLFFYASDYTIYQNMAVVLASILTGVAILGASWASWGIKFGAH